VISRPVLLFEAEIVPIGLVPNPIWPGVIIMVEGAPVADEVGFKTFG